MRRVWAAAVIPILLLASLALSADAPLLHDLTLPDPTLTPGVAVDIGLHELCTKKWGRDARHVTEAMKREVFHRYGLTNNADTSDGCKRDKHGRHHEIDHRLPRELGGADEIANLWSQCYSGKVNATMKDRLENFIHRQVCSGQMTLEEGQAVFLGNWITSYRHYFPSE